MGAIAAGPVKVSLKIADLTLVLFRIVGGCRRRELPLPPLRGNLHDLRIGVMI